MNPADPSEADRFLALLQPIERDLERYCRRLIWEPQDVPDAIQNAVLRAFAAFDRYHADASFRAWLFKILTREVFALNRRHARIAHHEFQIEPEDLEALVATESVGDTGSPGLATAALADSLDETLVAGLRTLSENERASLLLRAIPSLSYREIAETLGIPLGSVMGHLSRARQKMRVALGRSAARPCSSSANGL
jgi:RNA polymerase sigma-70 factor (ECF subfamily)